MLNWPFAVYILYIHVNSTLLLLLITFANTFRLISGPKVIRLFSRSTQLSTKVQLLIKTKIPTNEEVSFLSAECLL